MSILVELAAEENATALAAPRPQTSGDVKSRRIDRVLDHIHAHYTEELRVAELARIAALSPTAFHRMFLRHTRQTFIEYVKRLRVGSSSSAAREPGCTWSFSGSRAATCGTGIRVANKSQCAKRTGVSQPVRMVSVTPPNHFSSMAENP